MKRYIIIFITLLFFPIQTSWSKDIRGIKTITIIPFDNLTDENYSIEFNNALYDYLKREKFEVINKDKLEQFFIKRRIRHIGSINRTVIRELGKVLSADAIVMGSINELSVDKNPKVDLSAQIVDTSDSSIIWMNSVSISGDDFATFLDIGKIRSIEKLIEIAIKDLFRDLPGAPKLKIEKDMDMPPFEIAQARFYPKVVKGDSQVGLMVEVREIAGKPKQIYALVEDIKIPLISDSNNRFTGSFQSPIVEGTYILKLHAYGEFDTLYIFDAKANLIVDSTPPLINITSHNTFISPNNDGVNDYVEFFPELLSTDSLKGWRFEITDNEGRLVRSAEGGEELPTGLIWRGENNNFQQVNDGIYLGQLIVEDKAGHEVSTDKVMVIVDRRLPEIEIAQEKIEENIITFNVKCNNISKIVEWSIAIYNQKNKRLGAFFGKQNLPSTLRCAVNNSIDDKKEEFFYSVTVRDAAGNMLNVEKQPVKLFEPDEIAEEKNEKDTVLPPFEIVQARFYPKVVKGDSQVGLMVEVREIAGKPKQIYALVEDIKIPLISDSNNWFTGSFQSPIVEGTYILKLHAYGEFDTLYIFDAMASLIVDSTPPLINITSHNTFISPNNDGVNDYVAFFPELLSTDSLKGWRFEITDNEGRLVRSAEGGEELPTGLIWRGENNNFQQVNDGIYLGQLIVEDKAGHEVSTDKVMVIVDRRLPEIEITQEKIEENIITFNVKCNNISKIVEWSIAIYNQKNERLGAFFGKQNLPSTLRCAVNNSIDDKKEEFFYSVTVRDAAGNMLNVEKQPVKLFEPDEIAEEKKDPEWVENF